MFDGHGTQIILGHYDSQWDSNCGFRIRYGDRRMGCVSNAMVVAFEARVCFSSAGLPCLVRDVATIVQAGHKQAQPSMVSLV